jgi:hypothetical protein
VDFKDRVREWSKVLVITLPRKKCREEGIEKDTRVKVLIEKIKDE